MWIKNDHGKIKTWVLAKGSSEEEPALGWVVLNLIDGKAGKPYTAVKVTTGKPAHSIGSFKDLADAKKRLEEACGIK